MHLYVYFEHINYTKLLIM